MISRSDHDVIEKRLNAHALSWARILSAGTHTHNVKRITDNMVSSNSIVPPLYGLRKDHKIQQCPISGPATRPVCGANPAANYRLSHLLSLILSELWQRDRTGNVCMSSEEMMAEIARVNTEGLSENTVIGSTDVKALYPSLDIHFTVEKVCEVFKSSDVMISDVDYEELGLYLRLTRTNEDIEMLQLAEVCPTRRSNRGQRPTITSSGTAAKKIDRFKPWIPASNAPDRSQQREMLTEAL